MCWEVRGKWDDKNFCLSSFTLLCRFSTLLSQNNRTKNFDTERERLTLSLCLSSPCLSQVKTRLSLWLSFLPDPNSSPPEDDISSSVQCLAFPWIEQMLFLVLLPVSLVPRIHCLIPLFFFFFLFFFLYSASYVLLTKSWWSSVCFTQLFFFSLNALSFLCFI